MRWEWMIIKVGIECIEHIENKNMVDSDNDDENGSENIDWEIGLLAWGSRREIDVDKDTDEEGTVDVEAKRRT